MTNSCILYGWWLRSLVVFDYQSVLFRSILVIIISKNYSGMVDWPELNNSLGIVAGTQFRDRFPPSLSPSFSLCPPLQLFSFPSVSVPLAPFFLYPFQHLHLIHRYFVLVPRTEKQEKIIQGANFRSLSYQE